MPVGAFPGVHDFRKRAIRQPVNPLDKCTVISIYPKEIDEVKHTIQPGRFIIPAGTYEKPGLLVVGPSSWWKELEEEQPLLEIPNSSIQVADSLVKDYCNGVLACDMAGSMPGLFWIPGAIGVAEIFTKYRSELDKAREKQNRWYGELIKMADALWSRSQGNPLAISDDMRLAARTLGQNSKEWLQDYQITETSRCPACGTMRNSAFPICPTCKAVIDHAKVKELGLKFVE